MVVTEALSREVQRSVAASSLVSGSSGTVRSVCVKRGAKKGL